MASYRHADALLAGNEDAKDETRAALRSACQEHLALLRGARAWAEGLDPPAPAALAVGYLQLALKWYAEYAAYVIDDKMVGPGGTFGTAADLWEKFRAAAVGLEPKV